MGKHDSLKSFVHAHHWRASRNQSTSPTGKKCTKPCNCRGLPPCPVSPDFHATLLSLFANFTALADKHSLEYWVCAGTLLGAVRHRGLISWDDDVDLCAPAETIERLQNDPAVRASMRELGVCCETPHRGVRFGMKMLRNPVLTSSCIHLPPFPFRHSSIFA